MFPHLPSSSGKWVTILANFHPQFAIHRMTSSTTRTPGLKKQKLNNLSFQMTTVVQIYPTEWHWMANFFTFFARGARHRTSSGAASTRPYRGPLPSFDEGRCLEWSCWLMVCRIFKGRPAPKQNKTIYNICNITHVTHTHIYIHIIIYIYISYIIYNIHIMWSYDLWSCESCC
jgi:hypothetical protein